MSADVMADAVFLAVKGYVAKEFERMVAPLVARLHELEQRPPVIGQRGERGEKGLDGVNGRDGEKGERGEKGMDGSNGRDGKDGRDGERGEAGEKGERGEQGPAGKDGINGKDAEIDYDRLGNMIAVAVEKEIGKFPIPRDGRDGKDGRDGERGEKGDKGDRGEKGDPGLNGKDADEEVIVRRVRELIPTPRDGRDGINGKDGEPGQRGDKGEKGDAGRDGKDGAAGLNGKDGVPGERGLSAFDVAREHGFVGDAVTWLASLRGKDGESIRGDKGEPGRDGTDGVNGKDGLDGLTLDDFDAEYDDDSSILTLHLRSGERSVQRQFVLAVPRDADVYVKGRSYLKGQVVTYGGSAFIARRDTSAPIGGDPPSPDWRLLVKRGRDA